MIVGLLTAAVIVAYSDRLVLNLMIDPIRRDLRISDTQFSILQGVSFGLINALANPALAWLSDRTSRRWILICAMALWGAATMGCGLASQYGHMIGARALLGFGEAALLPTSFALICERFPADRRTAALSVLFTGVGVSAGIGVLTGGVLLKSAESGALNWLVIQSSLPPWRLVFVLMGIPPLLIALCLLFALKTGASPKHEASTPNAGAEGTGRMQSAPLLWGYLAAAAYLVAFWAEESWIPALLIRRHGFDAAAAGGAFGLITIVSGVLSPILGLRISDRLRRRYAGRGPYMTSAGSLLIAIPASLLLPAANTTVVISAALVLDTAILVSAFAFISSLQDLLPARHRALGLAIVYFVSGAIGASIGPTLVALATDRLYGAATALDQSLVIVLLPTLAISMLAFIAGIRSQRRRGPAPRRGGAVA
ncbi:MAG TPA: MFS transporter [Steroidobacteraceae bacterium]|nr:MFS transporter [Steroidobacteraceae bacterium]